ncbi:ChaN family lipoprotein [Solidesulfovibrio sp.]|uniref:ChaN family lipoprotein n=1 Tax=Solidesulfovibrio sp. TaxID=2910990 RepID=UPI00263889F9|nr:ChaN family lipoprotein [Solidesulfovibrio sp.]
MHAPHATRAASRRGRGRGLSRALAAFVLAALFGATLGGCAGKAALSGAGQPPVAPESLLTAAGAPLSPAAFAADFARADYILVGEEHPNPCDHLAQAAVIRRLAAAGVRPAIGLEMVPADRQDVLDAFHSGKLAVADLPHALDWGRTWGYPFALYAPIFEAAREYGLPVFALNAPEGLARKSGRLGLDGLSPAERAALPGQVVPPDPAQVEELKELFASHAAMMEKAAKAAKDKGGKPAGRPKAPAPAPSGRDRFAGFVAVQALWDTQMAQRAVYARALTGRPVVIVAGGGHVERGWGIAKRLAVFDPGARIVTVMPHRGGDAPDAALAGYFYACPAMHKSRLGMTLSHEAPAKGQAATGLLVTAVVPDSPAAKAGLLAGDAVTAAGSHAATSLAVLHTAAIEAAKAGEPLRLTVHRAGETLEIAIPLDVPTTPRK